MGSGSGGATTVWGGCAEWAWDWRGGGNGTALSGGVMGLTGGRVGDDEPAALLVPVSHAVHDVAPAGENVLAGQVSQTLLASRYWPAGHETRAVHDDAPAELIVPEGQAVQDVAPAAEYVPAAQIVGLPVGTAQL